MQWIPSNLSIDFVGKSKPFALLSAALVVAVLVGMALFSFNWGVDFAGGTELEVKFAGEVSAKTVRQTIEGAGFDEASVQEIGPSSEHSFLIRVGRVAMTTPEMAARGEEALRAKLGKDLASYDFNPDFGDKIEIRTRRQVPEEEVEEALRSAGLSLEKVNAVPGGFTVYTSGISERVKAALDKAAQDEGVPQAELRRVEFVGPQVGRELRNKGILSVLYASIAIVVYIAFRFNARFAPGAIAAMFHDIIITAGYFLVTRREFNLTSVAVLLTIVGYSVNDTIVIYDRVRENLGKMKAHSLAAVVNKSINECMSRTVLTSFSSFLALVGLLIFGVGQIWDFAMAMTVGIIAGCYSTIFIASPLTIWIEDLRKGRQQAAAPAVRAG